MSLTTLPNARPLCAWETRKRLKIRKEAEEETKKQRSKEIKSRQHAKKQKRRKTRHLGSH